MGKVKIKKKFINYSITAVSFLLVVALIGTYIFHDRVVKAFNSSDKTPIYSVETNEKKIALTFDSTWGEDNTIQILDILDKYKIKGTFFLIGRWIDDFSEEASEINKRGNEIANHSNKHLDFTKISKEAMIKDIADCDAKIAAITGKKPTLFRIPSGAYNDSALKVIGDTGHYCIQWDVDSQDWKNESSEKEYQRVIKKVKPGSILLFHNGAKYTPQSLEKTIITLQKEGYTFVKVSDLIYKSNYQINSEGKQIFNK